MSGRLPANMQDVLRSAIFPHSHNLILLGTDAHSLDLKDVTLFFLCLTPNLATVIPVMDIINEKLTLLPRSFQI